MCFDNPGTQLERQTGRGVVHRLLDPVFGFFVWAGHFFVIYITEAIACQLAFAFRDERVHSGLLIVLAFITGLSAAVVMAHGFGRWKRRGEGGDHGFTVGITAGNDALAAVAILWQLFPIFTAPVCR
jgi:hypothetical protein